MALFNHQTKLWWLNKTNNYGVIWANQFDNIANCNGHYETTGPEIWDQTEGKKDGFVCSSGTGGTIAGVSKFLKEKNKDIKIYLSDPKGSALYSHIKNGELKSEGNSITEVIGYSRITKYFGKAVIDTTSLDIISGSTIDFKKEMIGESFVINNPKASSSCGCGLSFSV